VELASGHRSRQPRGLNTDSAALTECLLLKRTNLTVQSGSDFLRHVPRPDKSDPEVSFSRRKSRLGDRWCLGQGTFARVTRDHNRAKSVVLDLRDQNGGRIDQQLYITAHACSDEVLA
jgi:hypothetical protein